MDCKAALAETNGDVEKAVQYLREKHGCSQQKSERSAKEGRVFTVSKGSKGAILELNCETDFVASNEAFIALGNKLAAFVLEQDINDTDTLSPGPDGKPVKEVLAEAVLKVGEN